MRTNRTNWVIFGIKVGLSCNFQLQIFWDPFLFCTPAVAAASVRLILHVKARASENVQRANSKRVRF